MRAIKLIHHVTMVVRSVRRENDRVSVYELADPDDWDLPPFTAGAHVDLRSRDGLIRQYSLCGDPADTNRYFVAIQREDEGRGGSRAFHAELDVGSIVPLSLPRNNFGLADARHHVLIAGGIGITPLLAMVHSLVAAEASFELHYCVRSVADAPFRDTLLALAPSRIFFYEAGSRLDVGELIGRHLAPDTHVYCCGPLGLIEEVLAKAEVKAPDTVHAELFGGAKSGGDPAYIVQVASTGDLVEVGSHQSMLEALRGAGYEIPSSCEAGACLECKLRYFAGAPVHRDLVMSSEIRKEFITPCVSGCAGGSITLDL